MDDLLFEGPGKQLLQIVLRDGLLGIPPDLGFRYADPVQLVDFVYGDPSQVRQRRRKHNQITMKSQICRRRFLCDIPSQCGVHLFDHKVKFVKIHLLQHTAYFRERVRPLKVPRFRVNNDRKLFSRLTDILDEDDATWAYLANAVREGLSAYWPEVEPDAEKLDALCSREALEEAEFTLHGMSLVLHYPAEALYADQKTQMAVTLFYPQIRDMMTESAQIETDNLSYYRTCALTFDDGPSGTNTPKVLSALMETGATATFFVIGNRIKDYQYLVQQEDDEGHAVASHNWHHGNVTKSSPSALRAMPAKVNKAMIQAIGIPVRYDRVPGGRYPQMVKAGVGWAYIQWSLDTYDWRGRSTANVLKKVQNSIQDGDIILCHDIKDNTPESTRQIVRFLEENGYLLLTVDELFAKDGVVLEPKKVYYRCTEGDTSIRKD